MGSQTPPSREAMADKAHTMVELVPGQWDGQVSSLDR